MGDERSSRYRATLCGGHVTMARLPAPHHRPTTRTPRASCQASCAKVCIPLNNNQKLQHLLALRVSHAIQVRLPAQHCRPAIRAPRATQYSIPLY